MPMKCIRLELARDADFPEGSRERGYEFTAPLDERGRLMPSEWRNNRDNCRVKQLKPGGALEIGALVWRSRVWAFDCQGGYEGGEQCDLVLGTHRFVSGEYVTFRTGDGSWRAFRVARVRDLD